MRKTAVVAGHVCLDIAPDLGALPAYAPDALLRPGRLTRVGPADVHTGGCVANAGLAFQKLGVSARLAARVGRDAFGELMREMLSASGAECALLTDPESATSYSVVLSPPGVDRVFLHHSGANERFTDADVPDGLLAGASLLHFGYPPLMPRMCERNGEPLARLFGRAHARGLATSLDMAAVDPGSEAAGTDWPALLARVLPATDFFLPSVEELCFMLDRALHARWLARAAGRDVTAILDIRRDVVPLAETLLNLGAKVAVVKCGARGLYFRTADEAALRDAPLDAALWANRAGFQPAFKPGKVVSATGAGDVSIAAFLTSALEGFPPDACARRAAAAGACCVEACDAVSGLPSLSALDRRVAAGWETNA